MAQVVKASSIGFKVLRAKLRPIMLLNKMEKWCKWSVKAMQLGTMVRSFLFHSNEVHSFVLGVISSTSIFRNSPNPNLWCIGIQFSRNVKNDNVMPEVQIAAGVRLVADIKRRYKDIRIYTHDQFNVVGKPCPGVNFPLARFTKA